MPTQPTVLGHSPIQKMAITPVSSGATPRISG